MVSDCICITMYHSIVNCLNPCSNGIWSLTCVCVRACVRAYGLNPCSNGIWSLTLAGQPAGNGQNRLNPCSNGIWSLTINAALVAAGIDVLILVLMEYGL